MDINNECGKITLFLFLSMIFDAIGSSLLSFTPAYNSGHVIGIIFGVIFIILAIVLFIKSCFMLWPKILNRNSEAITPWCQFNIALSFIVIVLTIVGTIVSSMIAANNVSNATNA